MADYCYKCKAPLFNDDSVMDGRCDYCRLEAKYTKCIPCGGRSNIPPGSTECFWCNRHNNSAITSEVIDKVVYNPKAVKELKKFMSPAVNDYTCPNCKNDKCSRTEKSCWLCGQLF